MKTALRVMLIGVLVAACSSALAQDDQKDKNRRGDRGRGPQQQGNAAPKQVAPQQPVQQPFQQPPQGRTFVPNNQGQPQRGNVVPPNQNNNNPSGRQFSGQRNQPQMVNPSPGSQPNTTQQLRRGGQSSGPPQGTTINPGGVNPNPTNQPNLNNPASRFSRQGSAGRGPTPAATDTPATGNDFSNRRNLNSQIGKQSDFSKQGDGARRGDATKRGDVAKQPDLIRGGDGTKQPDLTKRGDGQRRGDTISKQPDLTKRGDTISKQPDLTKRGNVMSKQPELSKQGDLTKRGDSRRGGGPSGAAKGVGDVSKMGQPIWNRPDGGRGGRDFVNRPDFDRDRNNFVNMTPRSYHYHGDWHHGDWDWHQHHYWAPSWGYRPWVVGGWGFGPSWVSVGAVALAAPWTWGYYGYVNPYWVAPSTVVVPYYVDYSQPIVVAAASAPAQQAVATVEQATAEEQASEWFGRARQQFRQGSYEQALASADQALALMPSDALLHEFRALCLFAVGNYQQSAATLYAVLSVGPGWDWATMSDLYPNVSVYTNQLRALEAYRKQNPEAADARFVLAYHYLVGGHDEAAATEFAKVVALQPNDRLSAQLLDGLKQGDQAESPPPALPTQAVNAEALVGDWEAAGPDGSTFRLSLADNERFAWTVNRQGNDSTMSGTYAIEENYLVLKASEANSLVGRVALEGPRKFVFKLAGDNPADAGLTFTR